jgi:hypothetical protein
LEEGGEAAEAEASTRRKIGCRRRKEEERLGREEEDMPRREDKERLRREKKERLLEAGRQHGVIGPAQQGMRHLVRTTWGGV